MAKSEIPEMADLQEALGQKHSLGAAVMLVAIHDFRQPHCHGMHQSAAEFLFPQSPEWKERFAWAVALMPEVSHAWLRSMLDSHRQQWLRERIEWQLRHGITRDGNGVVSRRGVSTRVKRRKLRWEASPAPGQIGPGIGYP